MRLLIITTHFYPDGDATSNCVGNIIDELPRDIGVDILATDKMSTKKKAYKWHGHDVYSYPAPGVLPVHTYKQMLKQNKGLVAASFLSKCLRCLVYILRTEFRRCSIKYCMYRPFRKGIKDLLKRKQYDAIIYTLAPIEAGYALNVLDPDIPCYIYQVDPYWNNEFYPADKAEHRKKLEIRLYQEAKAVFTTPIVKEYNEKNGFAEFKDKTTALEFPMLKDMTALAGERPKLLDKDYINIVFSGSMNQGVRTPDFLLDLLALTDSPGLRFIFVGGKDNIGLFEGHKNYKQLEKRIVLTKRLPSKEASAILSHADILLNLGNQMSNQVPSKLFEYMSYGKPIINLCETPKCPTIPYMEKYPLALSLVKNNDELGLQANQLMDFIEKKADNQLLFENIKPLFIENTPSYVASRMLAGILK